MDMNLWSWIASAVPHLLFVAALLVLWWNDGRQRFFLSFALAELASTSALWCVAPWLFKQQLPPIAVQLIATAATALASYGFFRAAMDFGEVHSERRAPWWLWLIPALLSCALAGTGHIDSSIRINVALEACGSGVLGYQLLRGSGVDRIVSIFVWLRASLWVFYALRGPLARIPVIPLPVAIGFGFAILVAGVLKSRRAVDELHAREIRLLGDHQRSFEQSTLARIKVDREFCIKEWNAAAEKLFGYGPNDAGGKKISDLIFLTESRDQAQSDWRDALSNGVAQSSLYTNVTKSGTALQCEWHHDVLIDDTTGDRSLTLIARDVTEHENAAAELRYVAYHDRLTELPNRLHFEEVLEDLSQRSGRDRETGVFFIDINSFKQVNDTYGHRAGDLFLLSVARRLKDVLPVVECLARFEGDEFSAAVVLDKGREQAREYAEAIHRVLDESVSFDGHQHKAMVNIGISFLQPETPWRTTLQEADIALTAAKRRGPQQTEVFHPEMLDQLLERVHRENALQHAIERDELKLVFQPQVDLKICRVTGVEALLRWTHEGEQISPEEFFPIAEQSDLIIEIGDWVLQGAIAQTARWATEGLSNVRMSVNVAPRQLARADFAEKLEGWLKHAGVSPKLIELEITERALLTPQPDTLKTFEALKRLGVSIALDDFGIGYSALAYLIRYPIDKIKIDRLFVREIGKENPQSRLTGAIIGIAHVMQVGIVAEGVETAAQASYLKERGCNEVQGYLISPPLSAEAIRDLLTNRTEQLDWASFADEAIGHS
ncbi:putative bifunctional diguanylate cyclase/phosphodiesterase [Edaphobacter flagellatus]|uniref:putative bifunctional diguanylate cyclase/phosphodiesterase n=1 Tax=Edaphobacter flagellatus TaxID=1933044 RepID=UPI0021B392ED|nr:GGDEF domain-containing phosphodiesterase [Edaphobacter flagellatus]